MVSSDNRAHFTFIVEGLARALQVIAFSGREAVSQPFLFEVDLVSEQPDLSPEHLLHKPAFLRLFSDECGIHGQIHSVIQGDSGVRLTYYTVTLRPQLAYLSLSVNQRIFQNLSVPEIIHRVLQQHGVQGNACTFKLATKYAEREYCVQYNESDLDFIQRLCEEEGIHFHFEHNANGHVLVFGDDQTSFPVLLPVRYRQEGAGIATESAISQFNVRAEIRASRTILGDYNFEHPRLTLESSASDGALSVLERYQYPGRFTDRERGGDLARRALERHRTDRWLAEGASDQPSLVSGHFLQLAEHPKAKWNDLWLLTEVFHEGRQPQVLEESISPTIELRSDDVYQGYRNQFLATPWDAPNRPRLSHPKPIISGSQAATVTGPEGQEIHCDQYGRVKVQFHWDRGGQCDESSSCWLRVASTWAGACYGGIAIPRIGMEVLVTFLEGDPDQPVVSGCLYHSENTVAYDLPTYKTRSTFKSSSTPTGGGFNEVRIEDRKGQEEIYLHAQRDWDERILHDRHLFVGNDYHEIVQAKACSEFKAEEHHTVHDDRKVHVHADEHLSVALDQHVEMGVGYSVETGEEIHMNSGLKIVLEAGDELTLKAGGSFIKLDGSGVTLSGAQIMANSGGSPGIGTQAAPLLSDSVRKADAAVPGWVLVPAQRQALMRTLPRCQMCLDGLEKQREKEAAQ